MFFYVTAGSRQAVVVVGGRMKVVVVVDGCLSSEARAKEGFPKRCADRRRTPPKPRAEKDAAILGWIVS